MVPLVETPKVRAGERINVVLSVVALGAGREVMPALVTAIGGRFMNMLRAWDFDASLIMLPNSNSVRDVIGFLSFTTSNH